MISLTNKRVYGYRAFQNLMNGELFLWGKHGEVFEYNGEVGKVLVWNSKIANKINDKYKAYPGIRIKKGDEPVFRFPIKDLNQILDWIRYTT